MITTKPITNVAFLISLRGELNQNEVDLLEDRLATVLAQGAQEIAIDLSGVSGSTCSSLVDVLRESAERLEAAGGNLLLASREVGGGGYRLARVRARRLDRVRGLHPSLDEALATVA